MSEEKTKKISPDKIKQIAIIVLAVVVIAGGMYFVKGQVGFGGGGTAESLDKLVEDEEGLNARIEEFVMGDEDSKVDAVLLYKDMKKFNSQFEKEAKSFVSHAKKVDINDEKEMKDFLYKEEILMDMASSESDCKMMLGMMAGFLEMSDISDKNKERIKEVYRENCEISRILDVCEVKRTSEYIEGEFEEADNQIIPVGFSVVTQEPEKGTKDKATVIYDGEEKGTAEVVTKEPVNGKKIKGTGSSEDVAKLGGAIFDEIVKLWNEQALDASAVLPYLSEANQNKAQEIEGNYKKIAYNWLRFSDAEPMYSQVNLKDNSYNKDFPFIMSLPIKVKGISNNGEISFYFSKDKGIWVSDYTTFQNMFSIVQSQVLTYSASPESFKYTASESCKDRYSFKVDDEVKLNIDIKNYATISTENEGQISNWWLDVEGYGEEWEWASWKNLPLEVIEYVNTNKDAKMFVKDFVYNSYGVECSSDVVVYYTLEE